MSARVFFKVSATTDTCAEYQRMAALGGEPAEIVTGLAALHGVNRPAIWKRLRAGGVLPPYRKGMQTLRRPPRTALEKDEDVLDMPRVDRDPCPRCGIRADVGCKHNRAPVGMVFG